MNEILSVKDMCFGWSSTPLFKQTNFSMQASDTVFLHGKSGAGKTTFLHLISGVLPIESGSIKLLNQNLSSMSAQECDRQRGDHIGYIFQMFNLMPFWSVLENVELACRFSAQKKHRAATSAGSVREAAIKLLTSLQLGDFLHRKVFKLSVGQQQRVAIARAFIGNPPLIIADEPTSALDADLRMEFMQLLFSRVKEQGSALLYVSHDRSLSKEFSRQVSIEEL